MRAAAVPATEGEPAKLKLWASGGRGNTRRGGEPGLSRVRGVGQGKKSPSGPGLLGHPGLPFPGLPLIASSSGTEQTPCPRLRPSLVSRVQVVTN